MNTHTLKSTPLVLIAASSFASAQITVTTLEDHTDFTGAQRVADLPGPDGKVSFREAVTAANNTPGPDTIAFAIPQDDWWLVPDYAVLKLEFGPFFITDDDTTVDFTTQTDFTGDTNPSGKEVGIFGLEVNGWGVPAILIDANNCVIRGLGDVQQRDAAVAIWGGDGNRIVGCVSTVIQIDGPNDGPATTNNIVGGTEPGDANTLEGVEITCWSNDNIVIGNTVRTVSVQGSTYCVRPQRNRIGGPTEAERNVIYGFGRLSNEGCPLGAGILDIWTRDTIIEGNYIGTTADGMAGVSQRGPSGIEVRDSNNCTIRNNLISSIRVAGVNHCAGQVFGAGIRVVSVNAHNLGTIIQGNTIGTDATGQNPIPNLNGILVMQATGIYTPKDTIIGGLAPGQANLIAMNEIDGVGVAGVTGETIISGNSIYSNGYVGIDLATWNPGWDGPTANDPMDTDTNGGNHLQNYPVITAATADGSAATVEGTLNSHANSNYRIEAFASLAADETGYGEGEVFLGHTDVVTDALGNADFSIMAAAEIPDGWVASTTATDLALGETSEFSLAVAFIVEASCIPDFTNDGVLNFFDVAAFLSAFDAGDPSAELTDDGELNFFDVAAFLAAFAAGCP